MVTGDGVRQSKLWKKLRGVEHAVLEDGDVEEALDGPGAVEVPLL